MALKSSIWQDEMPLVNRVRVYFMLIVSNSIAHFLEAVTVALPAFMTSVLIGSLRPARNCWCSIKPKASLMPSNLIFSCSAASVPAELGGANLMAFLSPGKVLCSLWKVAKCLRCYLLATSPAR